MIGQSLKKTLVIPVLCGFALTTGVFANVIEESVEGLSVQAPVVQETKNALEEMKDEVSVPVSVKKQEAPKVKSKSGVSMDSRLKYTSGAGETTLAELVKDKKAVLIDFWASWCGPCKQLMPELERKSQALPKQGVEVVAINTDDMSKAERFIKGNNFRFHSVIEANRGEYSKFFNISSIPCVVLLSNEGEVLFNGHPEEPGLQKALKALGVRY